MTTKSIVSSPSKSTAKDNRETSPGFLAQDIVPETMVLTPKGRRVLSHEITGIFKVHLKFHNSGARLYFGFSPSFRVNSDALQGQKATLKKQFQIEIKVCFP